MRAFLLNLAVAGLLAVPVAAMAAPSIQLEWSPAIPDHVENPGGFMEASCLVDTDGTTPSNLNVRVFDPMGTLIVDLNFPEATEYTLEWIVPAGVMDGVYLYQVNYVDDSGATTSAEGQFLVAGGVTGLCAVKFYDENGNGIFDGGEPLLEGWEMCYDGPSGQMCELTDENGLACFFGIDPGTYQLCETLQDGYECTNCEDCCCVTIDVAQDDINKFLFGNQEVAVPTIDSSWGQIKAVHR